MISFYHTEQTVEKILKRKNLSSIHRINRYSIGQKELVVNLKKGKRLTMEQVKKINHNDYLNLLGTHIEDDQETIRIEVLA